jgi:hypothetical protein
MLEVWQLSHVVNLLSFLSPNLPLHDMWLQSHPEIRGAYPGIDDCHDNQDNGNNSETGQILSNWKVIALVAGLVHSCKLENKVCQSTEEEEDCNNHSKFVLTSGPEGCHEKDNNRYRNCGDCEAIFSI